MGYTEVNLNLGCPSGTVTAKGKGSGFLAHPERAGRRFSMRCSPPNPLPVSVKTRLGYEDAGGIFRSAGPLQPLSHRLSHHPSPGAARSTTRGTVHRDVFAWALAESRIPLCYNGDLLTVEDITRRGAGLPHGGSGDGGPGLPWRTRRCCASSGAAPPPPGRKWTEFTGRAVPGLPGLLRTAGPRSPTDEGGLVLPDPPL